MIGTLPLAPLLDCEATGGSVSNSGLRDSLLFLEFAGASGGGAVFRTLRGSVTGGDEGKVMAWAAGVSTEDDVFALFDGGGVLDS